MTPTTRLGRGTIGKLADILDHLGAKRVFLVTGSDSYVACGAAPFVETALDGCPTERFRDFTLNPRLGDLERGLARFEDSGADVLLAVGGGSVLDMAKLIGYVGTGAAVALAGLAAEKLGLDGGVLQLQDFKINLPMIAAFLTIVGYSLNDTIVVFDRIRENQGRFRKQALEWIMNLSITETLSRTLITSGTTLLVVTALLVLGGEIIFDFSFALLIGVLIGTYSSIYVASSFVVLLNKGQQFHSASAESKAPVPEQQAS